MGGFLSQGILNEGTKDFMHQVDIPQLRFQGLHHQFVASAKAVKPAHQIDPQYKVGCMQIFATMYPLICAPDDVEKYDDGSGDLSRRKKASFDWYRKVIATNGEEL